MRKRAAREANGLPIVEPKLEADPNEELAEIADDDIDKLESLIEEADNQLANERRQIRRSAADDSVEEEG